MKKANKFTFYSYLLSFSLVLALVLPWGTAMGQEDEFTLEEVIVTAEFREKELQDTPLSITAISGDMLEARNQVTVDQIMMQSPNVSLRPGNATYGSSLTAYIRGIGQVDFNPSTEPGVGIYVDDVYYATITGNILELLDLERVEVLRGPQGTLAGRNAEGGAIKLFSKKPEGLGEGYFSITGGKFDRLDIRGAADFSLSDKLFMRIAGTSRARDGYVTSYDWACRHNLKDPTQPGFVPSLMTIGTENCELAKEGGQSMTAGRVSLRYMPSDNFEINFATNLVNDKSPSQASVLYTARDMAVLHGGIPNYFDNPAAGGTAGVYDYGIDVPYDGRFITAGTYMNYATYVDTGLNTPDPNLQGGVPGLNIAQYKPHAVPRINHLESRDYTLTLDIGVTDNISLKSITSYREYVNTFGDDNDGSPLAIQQLLQRMTHDQVTQEIRLNASLFDGFADLTLGGFYLDLETVEDARVNLNYIGFDFIHGPDTVQSTSKALYGQTNLHFTDKLDLTIGLRYSEDEKSYAFRRRNADGTEIDDFDPTILFDIGANVLGLPPGIVLGPYPFDGNQPPNVLLGPSNAQSVAYSSDRLDYRLALDYDLTEDVMVYAQIASGYRAGGNNARPFYPSQINAFEPEELINYEIGVKSVLADQLRLNASAFFNDFTDIQLNIDNCFFVEDPAERSPCASQENVGDAEVKGFELEGVWRPTNAFLIDFSYAWIDFEYTSIQTYVNPDGDTVPVSGAKSAPYTPESKWSLGAQYRLDLAKYGDLTYRLDVGWQDQQMTSGMVGLGAVIEDYYLVNGRVTWRSEDLKWQASLECTNLLDEYYYLTIFDLVDTGGTIFQNAQPGRPQEWAFTLKRVWYFD